MATESIKSGMINAIRQMGISQGKSNEEIEAEVSVFLNSLPKKPKFESASERFKPIIEDEAPSYGTNTNGIFCNAMGSLL